MKKFNVIVNGNHYEVEIEEIVSGDNSRVGQNTFQKASSVPTPTSAPDYSKYMKKTEIPKQMSGNSNSGSNETVLSPMPGNIWKILVEEGQEVRAGDILLILEAMKMENEILAPVNGKITKIFTSEGVAVDTGEKLIILN